MWALEAIGLLTVTHLPRQFFGYSSSTDVEKVLKQLAGDRKGSKARSMQVCEEGWE